MIGDTQSRKETPVKVVPIGYNGTAGSDLQVTRASAYGDLAQLISTGNAFGATDQEVAKQNPVRIPKPFSGDYTEIYLTFRLKLGDDEPSTRSMWIGYADSNTDLSAAVSMSESTIKAAHEAITGQSAGFQAGAGGYIQFDRLNITKLIRDGQDGKGWHGLAFLFDQKPKREYGGEYGYAIDNGYELQLFKIEAVARFKGTV